MRLTIIPRCKESKAFTSASPFASRKGMRLLLLMICCCLATLTATTQTQQQDDDYGGIKKKKEEITRTKTKRRIQAPLLGMQWQMLALDKQGVERPVDPGKKDIAEGEWFRLRAQFNQTGYVYVINQTVSRNNSVSAPQPIFQKNDVVAEDTVIELPAAGQSKYKRNDEYWWKKDSSKGRMAISIIFSRDQVEELTRTANQGRAVSGGIDYMDLLDLIQKSSFPEHKISKPTAPKQPKPQGIEGPFVTNVWNPNRANNEMLIELIAIANR